MESSCKWNSKPFSSPLSSSSNGNTIIGKLTIALSSSDTQKLTSGPNTLKLFTVSFDAYKPDIVTKAIIAVKGCDRKKRRDSALH